MLGHTQKLTINPEFPTTSIDVAYDSFDTSPKSLRMTSKDRDKELRNQSILSMY